MVDLERETDDLAARATLAAGKDAAKRFAASKSRRNKLIAYGIFGLLIVLGVLGLVASYWHWFLLLAALGLVGLYGWHRIRKRLASKGKPEQATLSNRERKRVELPREQPAVDASAREKAQAIEQQEIEDELAAMKTRLSK